MTLEDLRQTKIGQRFFAKVQITDTCWLWTACTQKGYGWFGIGQGKSQRSHAWLKAQVEGPPGAGLECCHTCNIRHCVNPSHIYYGTRQQNMQDIINNQGHNWSRFPKKREAHPKSVLTDEVVLELRRINKEQGLGALRLSRMFGLKLNTVNNVLYNKKRWIIPQ